MISPSFHRTACSVGPPVSGSIPAVKEPPVAQPRALIEVAWLKLTPGSAPRSVRTSFCHRKAWTRKQSPHPGALGSGIDVSAPPTTTPGLLMNWLIPVPSTCPIAAGPPNVSMSISLYRVCWADSQDGVASATNKVIAVMHVNVLDVTVSSLLALHTRSSHLSSN